MGALDQECPQAGAVVFVVADDGVLGAGADDAAVAFGQCGEAVAPVRGQAGGAQGVEGCDGAGEVGFRFGGVEDGVGRAYAELYFCDAYWPAFREIDFLRALRSFAARERRYGK
ncbi:undecaprenyl diphosphate synthase family protein [Kitasatospora aureofaciens]|nr:undecaprenyl diphosphate synthase family protein [Kitasatospora aureofaciens]